MAQIKSGANGGFSGKAGSVIGYQYRGKSYIKGLASRKPKKPSAKQLESRARFGMIQKWRSQFTNLFAITFKNHTHERSAQNAAHAFNVHIVKGEYPDFIIDRSEMVISSGSMSGLKDLTMNLSEDLHLNFTWDTIYHNGAIETDLLTLLVWYQDGTCEVSTTAAQRMDKKLSYVLRDPEKGSFADIYVAVLSDDRERAANSVYMGRIEF